MDAHPIRGRFNAWVLGQAEEYLHAQYGGRKSQLLANLPATVLELGPGAGANMRYLPRGTRLIAIEPNQFMHEALRRRARQLGIELDLRGLAGEALDLDDASVDFAFSSLVMCSVADPAQVLTEVRRVLRPEGRFACLEHVAAPPRSAAYWMQRLLRRPWRWLFEGCELCRDTAATLRASGFSRVHIEAFEQQGFPLIRHHVAVVCVK